MKIIKLLAVAFLGLSIVACSSDSDKDAQKPVNEDAVVSLRLTTAGMTRGITGEENPVGNEGLISNFEVYVFNSDGTVDAKVGSGNNGYLTKTSTETNFNTVVTAGNGKHFVVLANTNIGAVANLAALDAELSALEFQGDDVNPYNTRTIPATGFEMSGFKTIDIAAETTTPVTIGISRMVSKVYAPKFATTVPVELTKAQFEYIWPTVVFDELNLPTLTFSFTSYALCSGRSKSDVLFKSNAERLDTKGVQGTNVFMPSWDLWTNTGKDVVKPDFKVDGSFNHNYSGLEGTSWMLTAAGVPHVYAYENKPDVNPDNVTYDAETVTCYIIEGTLSGTVDGNSVNVTRYWAVDIVAEYDRHVLRNCTYDVTINKIITPGENTPEKAWNRPDPPIGENAAAEISVVVNKWRVFESSTGM